MSKTPKEQNASSKLPMGNLSKIEIEKIIAGVVDWAESGRSKYGRPDGTLTPKEATQSLLTLFESIIDEVVGADEPDQLVRENGDGSQVVLINPRNLLRVEQRARKKELI